MAKRPPMFRVFSIGFGGANLPMRDLQSNLVIGRGPEWVFNAQSAPAAYPRGVTPHLSVVFHAANIDEFPAGEAFTIQATGKGVRVPPRRVSLALSPKRPLSVPHLFPMAAPFGGEIGIRTFTLTWTATDHLGKTFTIGKSTHTIYVTWKPAVHAVPPFEPLVRAAVRAAAGKKTVTGITGKLVKAVTSLVPVRSEAGGSVRMALLQKRADSAGFSAVLVQMLMSHGILAVTRAISVNWKKLPKTELAWVPTGTSDDPYAYCVTLVAAGSGVSLCDAESGVGPVELAMHLPPDAKWTLSGPLFETVLHDFLEPAARHHAVTKPQQPPPMPVTPFTVHFQFPGSNAIVLRDVVQDVEIGVTPEWVAGMTNFAMSGTGLGPPPAAFVTGAAIAIEVTFLRTIDAQDGGAAQLTLTIGATGTPAGVTEQTVTLTFDADGRSDAHRFTLTSVVAKAVGFVSLNLTWYVRTESGKPLVIGDSTHPLYFTWKTMAANPSENLPEWAYAQVVRWTSTFAAGAASDRDVCDKVFAGLPRMGLQYGVPGWMPRQMLLGGGGMCGGWYQLFQLMAHSQGVFVEKAGYLVDWRVLEAGVQWNAIVMSNGGVNQQAPAVPATAFHDIDKFPIPATVKVTNTTARRYRFWGNVNPALADGHGINFLVGRGMIVLYDPSFSIGPVELAMPLPPSGEVLGGARLEEFVAKYLRFAVEHMLGSFVVNGKPMVSEPPVGSGLGVNGASLVTAKLPVVAGGQDTITFRWV